jgi:hypothetical protein
VRLARVEHGHRLKEWAKLTLIRVVSRNAVPDVVRTMLYRPEIFGGPFSAWMQEAMRGPSVWSVGERELFAAFVSSRNQCLF